MVNISTDQLFPGIDTSKYTINIEYNVDDNPIYIGVAIAGSLPSASVWAIRKITYDGNNPTKIEWANRTTTFDKSYDLRATYSYS